MKIISPGMHLFPVFFLGVMGAFETLSTIFLGSLVWKKRAPFKMIAKNVAFEKTSLITVTKLFVLLYQHH